MSISKKVKESKKKETPQTAEKPSIRERILLKEYQVGFTKFLLFLNPNGYLRINQEADGEYRGGITIAPSSWEKISFDVHWYIVNKERFGKDEAIKILQTDYKHYEDLKKIGDKKFSK